MNSKAIRKQLLAAVAMVLVAAVALGSSTYAWFVASGTVKATGMKVTVQTEGGIMIRGVSSDGTSTSEWGTTAQAVVTDKVTLYPTSTIDLTSWVHASSRNEDSADNKHSPDTVAGETVNDIYKPITANHERYRRVDSFAIRSASGTDIENASLRISSVKAETAAGATVKTALLNKAIRVGVCMTTNGGGRAPDTDTEKGSKFYIYAPSIDNSSFELTAVYSNSATLSENKSAGADDFLFLTGDIIPGAETGAKVDIYTWYEGEDPNCKNTNLVKNSNVLTPDELTISVEFTQDTIANAKKSKP